MFHVRFHCISHRAIFHSNICTDQPPGNLCNSLSRIKRLCEGDTILPKRKKKPILNNKSSQSVIDDTPLTLQGQLQCPFMVAGLQLTRFSANNYDQILPERALKPQLVGVSVRLKRIHVQRSLSNTQRAHCTRVLLLYDTHSCHRPNQKYNCHTVVMLTRGSAEKYSSSCWHCSIMTAADDQAVIIR